MKKALEIPLRRIASNSDQEDSDEEIIEAWSMDVIRGGYTIFHQRNNPRYSAQMAVNVFVID